KQHSSFDARDAIEKIRTCISGYVIEHPFLAQSSQSRGSTVDPLRLCHNALNSIRSETPKSGEDWLATGARFLGVSGGPNRGRLHQNMDGHSQPQEAKPLLYSFSPCRPANLKVRKAIRPPKCRAIRKSV